MLFEWHRLVSKHQEAFVCHNQQAAELQQTEKYDQETGGFSVVVRTSEGLLAPTVRLYEACDLLNSIIDMENWFKDWTNVQIGLAAFAAVGIAYMAYSYLSKPKDQRPERKVGTRVFTFDELKQYDGEKSPQVYVALKGVVYDVSSSCKS